MFKLSSFQLYYFVVKFVRVNQNVKFRIHQTNRHIFVRYRLVPSDVVLEAGPWPRGASRPNFDDNGLASVRIWPWPWRRRSRLGLILVLRAALTMKSKIID